MSNLTNEEIQALAKAVNLTIEEPELTQVRYNLNAILEVMESIEVDGLSKQEPLPIIPPQEGADV